MSRFPNRPLLFLLAALFALLGCRNEAAPTPARGGPGGPPGGRPPTVVTVAAVDEGEYNPETRFVATLQARVAADVYARTSGPIVAMLAHPGDQVRQGQVLARINDDEALKQLQQAGASLRMAEATMAQRQAQLRVAEQTAQRVRRLAGENLISERDQEQSEAELAGAVAQLDLSRAQIEQARANVNSAEIELQKTRIVAPFNGFVGRRHLDLGDYAATNRPVFTLVDVSTIRTAISIPEREALTIQRGQPASVTTSSYPDTVFRGVISRIAPIFDARTNTTEAEVEIDNHDGRLKPGMFANVHVGSMEQGRALLVPASSVLTNGGERAIFVAEEAPAAAPRAAAANPASAPPGGKPEPQGPALRARKVDVRILGQGADGKVAVEPLSADLQVGARVITLGHEGLSDGATIRLGRG
jgi:RND family efflux transporter MFP subunit